MSRAGGVIVSDLLTKMNSVKYTNYIDNNLSGIMNAYLKCDNCGGTTK